MGFFGLLKKKRALIPLAAIVTLLNNTPVQAYWSNDTKSIVYSIRKMYNTDKRLGESLKENSPYYIERMKEFLDSLGNGIISDIDNEEFGKARKQLIFLIELQNLSTNGSIKKKITKLRAGIQLAIKKAKNKDKK